MVLGVQILKHFRVHATQAYSIFSYDSAHLQNWESRFFKG